ncbi:hypothetical protein [Kinneretia aquatilis]|uniref:hypothetical protein n=1 Tax=Kinneretia aquatilis TaxID=2070761 RepID=UPI00149542E5|nr:hypothetical protein [Paucibacter aquatile]WIV99957.1 hypothetical protein K9V56_011025 [Paucibacter aquatile]
MIVIAGAGMMMTSQLADHRRLVLETQVQQDLRAAADLMLREIRRAGAWTIAQDGIWAPGTTTPPVANQYAASLRVTGEDNAHVLTYAYAKHKERTGLLSDPAEDNAVDANTESFGFKLEGGMLRMRLGGRWQPMTDSNSLVVSSFIVSSDEQSVSLIDSCPDRCEGASVNCPPRQIQRLISITLTGVATHDSNVVRQVTVSGKVRNDDITGTCS